MLLVLVAIVICTVGVAVGVFLDNHHINLIWFLVGGNSILIIAIFVRDFRANLRRSTFLVYLLAWAIIHGLSVALAMRWLGLGFAIIVMGVELTLGYFCADYFFDIRPEEDTEGESS